GRQRVSGPELLMVAALLVIAGAVLSTLGSRDGPGRGASAGGSDDGRPSIAVLPLENRSGLEEDGYFTDGIHDEILTHLSRVSGLSVRGRTSVMEYRDSPKNLRQIGEELNARYLMEGGVQRAGETVRINVQLVDAEADEHVFADTYDRELSVENLLAVQREVALRVASALETTLTAGEREQIETLPTTNLAAYDYYLRGQEYWRRPGNDNRRIAKESYREAIELDPEFALPYAALSLVYSLEFYNDRVDGNAAETKSHGVVTCMTIAGNEAWLGGYATSGLYAAPPYNWVRWHVKDNGQGKQDPPDQISLQTVGSSWGNTMNHCANTPVTALYDIEAGNIKVNGK
ncbi:hypothetical protein ACFL3S_09480, partial [Gemmatimonadota bacterium]